jgi:hypothetical protein
MPLSSQAVNNVKAVLDRVTKDGATGINGLVFVAVDRKGETLVEHASGTRSVNSKEKMDMDTTFCKLSVCFSFPSRERRTNLTVL